MQKKPKTSQARIKASVTYNRGRDSITLRPSTGAGAAIRAAAAAAGLPLQTYIVEAVNARMTAEGLPLDLPQDDKITKASDSD